MSFKYKFEVICTIHTDDGLIFEGRNESIAKAQEIALENFRNGKKTEENICTVFGSEEHPLTVMIHNVMAKTNEPMTAVQIHQALKNLDPKISKSEINNHLYRNLERRALVKRLMAVNVPTPFWMWCSKTS